MWNTYLSNNKFNSTLFEEYLTSENKIDKKIGIVMFAGLARGSKYWSCDKYDNLEKALSAKLLNAWETMPPAFLSHWAEACSLILAKQDIRRYKW
uniref:Uncharacterized protein n=1 Tax=Rhabditophanes sp. KR3021 TaxID=114890 RepID=A0AC35UA84_9BILA